MSYAGFTFGLRFGLKKSLSVKKWGWAKCSVAYSPRTKCSAAIYPNKDPTAIKYPVTYATAINFQI